jgi:hypothetical protein
MDQGSLLTIDVLLTDPADIEGGVLQTLEADDQLRGHAWERGDALVFLSHKYHTLCRNQGLYGQLARGPCGGLAEARRSSGQPEACSGANLSLPATVRSFDIRYHCVSELTRGTRQVLVCELWQGTENPSPSRDEEHRWRGEWKDEWRGGAAEAEVL